MLNVIRETSTKEAIRTFKRFGIINVIMFKADAVSTGNYQNRKDEKSCSLETFNNPNYYRKYKN